MKTTTESKEILTERLARVEAELADMEQRMPAHSVKPAFMAALFDLEDERDRLIAQIEKLQAGAP